MVRHNSNRPYGVAAAPGAAAIKTIRRLCVALSLLTLLGACASLPPGSHYPKAHSEALSDGTSTRLSQEIAVTVRNHAGRSGFRIINVGVDGFLMRLEMINAAERTLDLQYFIFREDESGHLLSDALVKAADRGVRIRILVDDGDTVTGDEQLLALSGHAAIEIRVFNPFAYRGHSKLIRGTEYLLRHARLDYRMHNKLFVADNAIALTGGRNVGDQYFQIDPASQFADDDVFVVGSITQKLSAEFDEYWNSALAIPAEALRHRGAQGYVASANGDYTAARQQKVSKAGFDYRDKLAHGEPLASVLAGQQPLIWADAQVVYDSPDKKPVVAGALAGSLMYEPLANDVKDVQSELLVATPYLIPTKGEMRLLEERREHGVRVRILTNSLEAAPDKAAHAGYMHYRGPLLKDGVELYEVRSLLGSTRGSGESVTVSRYGNYALHGKIFVMDREKLYIGSMNFDQRSRRLNTEMGLIINSADLSQQMATRFEAMVQKKNAYTVALRSHNGRNPSGLVWQTDESGTAVEYQSEPARSDWQKFAVKILTLLPLDPEL
ncbi:MAG TPA: phospholipase D family protein [Steroidobacteraceae bacterium]|jgi:putative cardiolipin synthase|nr:phospholipase D family protein [Steroidobacteraceae bacterium]